MQIAVHPCFLGFAPADHVTLDEAANFRSSADLAELARIARDSDALLILATDYNEAFAKTVSAPGSRLRLIQFLSAGYESAGFFGVPAGVAVCNASEVWAPLVAEHAVALMLGLLRQLPQLERHRTARIWDRDSLEPSLGSLDGARVGIFGYGTIGREIAQRLKPFGADIIGIARSAKACEYVRQIHPLSDMTEIIPQLDVLVNVVPSSAETRHLFNAASLSLLRKSALLINVGRGATIDEMALASALRNKRLGGAGLDVFEAEPLPKSSPFWSLDNVIISPHAAGYGSPGIARRAHDLCNFNLNSLSKGTEYRSQVMIG